MYNLRLPYKYDGHYFQYGHHGHDDHHGRDGHHGQYGYQGQDGHHSQDGHHVYLIFVIFFTRTKFLENKIYTEKRQFFALNL